mgnify:CR=1 FL=1
MNKVILFFRNLFFRKLLPWFLGALGMVLIMITTDEFQNIPMLIMLSIFVIGAYLSSSHSDVHFLNDTDLLDKKIKKLFKNANQYLFIISPYFNAGRNRLNFIIDAKNRGCDVTVLVNKNALINKNTVDELLELKKLKCTIKTHPNIHSKIYLNEKNVITGSVNLVKGSFNESLEIGVQTSDIYEHKEIYGIIKEEYLADPRVEDFDIDNISKGYCISSKTRIIYNVKSPMERSVYLSSGNRSGKYCHKCGKESETSVQEPLCEDCK